MNPATRLHGLDALRGIAALCVLGLHVHAIYGGFPDLFGKAYLAVDFFFMLSGYLMARTYGQRLSSGLDGAAFLALRYRRLWPTMAIGGAIGLAYLWDSTRNLPLFAALALANLALIPASFQRELFPLNVPAWSVFLELLANLVHGYWLWRLSQRWLVWVAALALLATLGFAAYFGTLDLGARPETLTGGVARALLSYTIGMILWHRWQRRPPLAVPPLAALAGLPVLVVLPWLLGIGHWSYDLAFVLLACPLLMAGGLAFARPSPLAVWLGNASFPLYAVHFAALRKAQLMGLGRIAAIAAVLVITALVTLWTSRRQLPYGTAAKGGN
jgi:peptidoglycan/LPS O-acetylase OafA/YrhL